MRILALSAGLALLVSAGCEPARRADRIPVTTRVTFANGQPVSYVLCCFVPHTALQTPAEFPLDASGNVTRTAAGVEPRLHPGKFTVYFQPIERGNDKARSAATFKAIPARYTQMGDTGLEIEVSPGQTSFDIRLEQQ